MAAVTILEGHFPEVITLKAGVTATPGQLLGYSDGWVLADGDAATPIPAKLVAGAYGIGGENIQAYGMAKVGGADTDATVGAKLYISGTPGGFVETALSTPTNSTQLVGMAVSATDVLLFPALTVLSVKVK